MKGLGAMLVLGASAYAGITGAAELRRRAGLLHKIEDLLLCMGREIGERLTPLPLLLDQLEAREKGPINAFCASFRMGLETVGTEAAWTGAVRKLEEEGLKEDLDPLRPLGALLGRYSAAEQSAALLRAAKETAEAARRADQRARVNARLWTGGGLCGGLITILLLL